MKNVENKIQILNENRGEVELKEYIEMSAQSDPNFFRWLFDAELENDFDSSLTEDQKEKYKLFIESL
jgi:succinate dehydrogenase flavin-adding protein (antitoxin of CptAB toxin-antitoxin module)